MSVKTKLPFKVGHEAELKCFEEGYRGAWFRSKIHNIRTHNDQIDYLLQFYDFAAEEFTWTKLYEELPKQQGESGSGKMVLMLRPSFPPCYLTSQLPNSFPNCDAIAILSSHWKVGDLVDWKYKSCYWSGRITQLNGKTKATIKLHEPPYGEGKSYVALVKNLRPSLDWSFEHGWTIPLSRETGEYPYCARLLLPPFKDPEQTIANAKSKRDDAHEGEPNPMKLVSGKDRYRSLGSSEGGVPRGKITAPFNLTDSIESSIVELEALTNKVRWLKGLVRLGSPSSSLVNPSWEFASNRHPPPEKQEDS